MADRTPSFETDPAIGPDDPQAEGHDVVGDEFIEPEREERREEAAETRRKRGLRKPLLLAAPIIVLIGALFFYLHGGRYESNDDAFVQSGLVSISPNVEGRVIALWKGGSSIGD